MMIAGHRFSKAGQVGIKMFPSRNESSPLASTCSSLLQRCIEYLWKTELVVSIGKSFFGNVFLNFRHSFVLGSYQFHLRQTECTVKSHE